MFTRLMMGSSFLFALFSLGCASSVTINPAPTAKWVSNMHGLSAAYIDLLPYVGDARGFSDPRNHDSIQNNLREMQIASSAIAHDPQPPNADPILGYTATRFAIEMRQAANAF